EDRPALVRGPVFPECQLPARAVGLGHDDGPAARWERELMTELINTSEQFPVTVVARGPISDSARRRVREVVLRAVRHERSPVTGARVALELHPDPAVEKSAEVRVSLDVNGRIVRAAAAAPEMIEAIDLLDERIRRNLRASDEELRRSRGSSRRRTA